jgi:pSer/pThr/pTyr-binding forkhead associated (FHA) protein
VATGERIRINKDATAGRGDTCEILLTEGRASRTHARLTFSEGSFWVKDMGSGNGTYVNDERITEPVALKPGDRLRFALEEFEVTAVELNLPSQQMPKSAQVTPSGRVVILPVGGSSAERSDAAGTPAVAPAPAPPAAVSPASAPPAAPPVEAPPPPAAAQPSEPLASAVAPEVSAVSEDASEMEGAQKRPGAWAGNLTMHQAKSKTKYLPPSTIKELMGAAAAPPPAPAVEIEGPYLLVVSGVRASKALPLEAGQAGLTEWTVGSDPQRDVLLPDQGVSAFHARVINEGRRWKVVDQMSANGTFVNGKRASISYVSDGDRILFGPVECIFHAQAATAPAEGTKSRRWIWVALAVVAALGLLGFLYAKMVRR